MLRRWLDTWHGLGDVVTGMNRQGYMLHLSIWINKPLAYVARRMSQVDRMHS